MPSKIKTALIGATGYAGQELVSILINHPKVDIEKIVGHSTIGEDYASICPKFSEKINLKCQSFDELIKDIDSIDLVFITVPHGQSNQLVKVLSEHPVKIIDLGGDFRLDDLDLANKLYQTENGGLLKQFVYGLCELNKEKIKQSHYVASPGCYATAMQLALLPLLGKLDMESVLVDGKSGISGAGKSLRQDLLYSESAQNLKAYNVTGHRHKYEVQMTTGLQVSFIPHLIPMYKGILCSVYIKLKETYAEGYVESLFDDYYSTEPFVRVTEELSQVKNVIGSNYCDLSIRMDEDNKTLMVFSCIDNLKKGAAGQAVQNMNLMFGLNEDIGLN
jgi:N-acetyl-gamma-glutamyl-phosphate reductase